MKRLNIGVLIGIFIIVTIPSIIQSCCVENMKISTEYRFNAYSIIDDQYVATDTLNSEFELDISFYWDLATNTNFNMLPSAYATSCRTTFVNELLENSLAMTLNSAITFDQQLIEPGTDILALEGVNIRGNSIKGGNIRVYFSQRFTDKIELASGSYIFQLTAETTDGILMSAEK